MLFYVLKKKKNNHIEISWVLSCNNSTHVYVLYQ